MAIVQQEILKALNNWGESLIAISRAYEDDGLGSVTNKINLITVFQASKGSDE